MMPKPSSLHVSIRVNISAEIERLTKIFPVWPWPYRPNSLSLYLLEKLTFSHCVTEAGDIVEAASCATDHGKQLCMGAEGSCVVWLDGYTVQVNPIDFLLSPKTCSLDCRS